MSKPLGFWGGFWGGWRVLVVWPDPLRDGASSGSSGWDVWSDQRKRRKAEYRSWSGSLGGGGGGGCGGTSTKINRGHGYGQLTVDVVGAMSSWVMTNVSALIAMLSTCDTDRYSRAQGRSRVCR